jgi:hypothetical protein
MGRLNRIGERCLLGLQRVFKGFRINAKENIARFEGGARLDGNVGHYPADAGDDRRGVEVESSLTAEAVNRDLE